MTSNASLNATGGQCSPINLDVPLTDGFPSGLVWLVGAGPGDPGLLTLHGLSALRQADLVVYDALVDPRLLEWARPGAEVVYAGKRGGKPSPKQRDITLRLIAAARAGRRVLRLKGGDRSCAATTTRLTLVLSLRTAGAPHGGGEATRNGGWRNGGRGV